MECYYNINTGIELDCILQWNGNTTDILAIIWEIRQRNGERYSFFNEHKWKICKCQHANIEVI